MHPRGGKLENFYIKDSNHYDFNVNRENGFHERLKNCICNKKLLEVSNGEKKINTIGNGNGRKSP